jgi:hypothetical protein
VLDPLLIVNEAHCWRVMKAYIEHYNRAPPHQGIKQRFPIPLGGIIHEYRRGCVTLQQGMTKPHSTDWSWDTLKDFAHRPGCKRLESIPFPRPCVPKSWHAPRLKWSGSHESWGMPFAILLS